MTKQLIERGSNYNTTSGKCMHWPAEIAEEKTRDFLSHRSAIMLNSWSASSTHYVVTSVAFEPGPNPDFKHLNHGFSSIVTKATEVPTYTIGSCEKFQ